jgi:uracil-DNA glycosylase
MTAADSIKLDSSWKSQILDEFEKPYMQELKQFLKKEIVHSKKKIFPAGAEYFAALNYTSFEKVKVVILGQDPYHGPGQAHGLCFSVKPGVQLPPSLQNIYKELYADLKIKPAKHGYLRSWAEQGVLLLNSVLTVEMGRAGSHQNRGWEKFTDRVIAELNGRPTPLAFVLWGAYAQKKGAFIDRDRHLVIESPHPSPLSAHRGFFGSRPFSKINDFLRSKNLDPIQWELPEFN